VDALALVQLGCFQDPHVVPAEVAEGHRLPEEKLFEDFVLIKTMVDDLIVGVSFGLLLVDLLNELSRLLLSLLVSFTLFLFFSLVLLYHSDFVLVEVLEDIIIIENSLLALLDLLNFLGSRLVLGLLIVVNFVLFIFNHAIDLVEVPASPFLDVIKSVEGVHELNHAL